MKFFTTLGSACLLAIVSTFGPAIAQDNTLPAPSLAIDSDGGDGVQIAHSLSIRLRTNYCYHQFVMAYGGDEALTDVKMEVHFGLGGQKVASATPAFSQLGGTFIDDKFLSFGLNAPCQVDEFRVVEFEAKRGEDTISMSRGLTLTSAILTDLPVTQGLPLNEENSGAFGGTNILTERVTKCISGRANLRGGPSTSNVVLATLQPNAEQREVTILAEVENGDWFEVQTSVGRGFLYYTLLSDC